MDLSFFNLLLIYSVSYNYFLSLVCSVFCVLAMKGNDCFVYDIIKCVLIDYSNISEYSSSSELGT